MKLPRETYLPGINAHPEEDPDYPLRTPHNPHAEDWRELGEYLYGVDLYNHGYWWESHEAWERVWQQTDKDSPMGQFLQGLIQISAAFIKWRLKQKTGLNRLYQLGVGRLTAVENSHEHFMGLDLTQHLKKIRSHFHLADQNLGDLHKICSGYPYIALRN